MPNFFQQLRMQNNYPPQGGGINPVDFAGGFQQPQAPINFGPTTMPPPTPVMTPEMSPPQPDIPMYDAGARMKELYQPSTVANDAYQQGINNYPEYQKPGWLRAIAGALSAFGPGGHETGMGVMNQPNQQRMTDWKNKMPQLQLAADNERNANVDKRNFANQTITGEQRAQSERDDRIKNTAADKQKTLAYQLKLYKQEHPDAKFDFSGPEVIMTDVSGKITRTGVKTGEMSEIDKITMNQTNALAQIGARGAQTRLTDDGRAIDRTDLQDRRAWDIKNVDDPDNPGKQKSVLMNSITGETKPLPAGVSGVSKVGTGTGAGSKDMLPSQRKVYEFNKARELTATRPELAKWITVKPGNTFEVAEPAADGTFGGQNGPTPQEYEDIRAYIYGSNRPTGQVSGPPAASHANSQLGTSGRPRISVGRDGVPVSEDGNWKYVKNPTTGGWTPVQVR